MLFLSKLYLIEKIDEKIQKFKENIKENVEIVPISSITRKNVDDLVKKVYAKLITPIFIFKCFTQKDNVPERQEHCRYVYSVSSSK